MSKQQKAISRRLKEPVLTDLNRKMAFLAGPRQSGKTTFSKLLLKEKEGHYYNYDYDKDRALLLKSKLDPGQKFWIFDEIHKYSRWRNWLKGLYDKFHDSHQILVTGSAKLDIYSRGGDSLQGRYFLYRFHPLTLSEICGYELNAKNPDIILESIATNSYDSREKSSQNALKDLLNLGPFPEPFFSSQTDADRWRLSYSRRVIHEDIQSLERVNDLALLELLFYQLPNTIGSPLSINSLREDLSVSHESAKKWLEIFEKIYLSYRISPYGSAKIKAVKKEQKLYLWDWVYCNNPAARLENLVANHLLRFTHWCEDIYGIPCVLRYYKSTENKEVDFVILKKQKPWFCVEVKTQSRSPSSQMKYFMKNTGMKLGFHIHEKSDDDYEDRSLTGTKIRVMPIWKFLSGLP